MRGLVFDIRGTTAHFRRPDTTSTHMTYPFITPTAVKGLIGAILGIEDFTTKDKVGIRLLNPVKIVSQQMSMLGKKGGAFNRPTTIELLVNPYYRIYYSGEENFDKLKDFLENKESVYPTYLGSAYALTQPELVGCFDDVFAIELDAEFVSAKSVVPTALIEKLKYIDNRYFCRAGGFMYEYKGNREFEKSIDFIYEQNGKEIEFLPRQGDGTLDIELVRFGDEAVCLF